MIDATFQIFQKQMILLGGMYVQWTCLKQTLMLLNDLFHFFFFDYKSSSKINHFHMKTTSYIFLLFDRNWVITTIVLQWRWKQITVNNCNNWCEWYIFSKESKDSSYFNLYTIDIFFMSICCQCIVLYEFNPSNSSMVLNRSIFKSVR